MEGPHWTLETEGMREMKCTLSFDSFVGAQVINLKPGPVTVERDRALGEHDSRVDFAGCSGLMLASPSVLPLVVAGRCHLTAEDARHFRIQFRAAGNSRLRIAWPDHTAVLQCPACRIVAAPDDARTAPPRVMLWHSLIQCAGAGVASRILPRLMCWACFERATRNVAAPAMPNARAAGDGRGPWEVALV